MHIKIHKLINSLNICVFYFSNFLFFGICVSLKKTMYLAHLIAHPEYR